MASNSIGFPFIELPAIDSTNNYAMALLHEGMAQHGTAVFTHHQQKGKGQRNKQWISQKDMNIAVSIILEPDGLDTSQLFFLSMTVAIAARNFFNNYAGSDVSIKWPNDIYWRDRKAGGILIENTLKGNTWKYAIAGIGFNINQTDFGELNNKAVSLKQITGNSYQPVTMAKDLCVYVEKEWKTFLGNQKEILNTYNGFLYKKNEKVKLKKDNRIFETVIKNVLSTGELVVQSSIEEHFKVGEIEWML
ncbi:MAG TPA: biotin--[acetyl-CoA-carboxylase] ligase [Flavisolibacter sp.]|nr:biotin--[acetyl-CoA-carboxylase] ligase [Flavisolibacter sp.]